MKELIKIIKNLIYMTSRSFKFASWIYIYAFFQILLYTIDPFINILFPKWILDELSGEKQWKTLLWYLLLWVTINGISFFLKMLDITFVSPYLDKSNMRENLLYSNLDAKMDYEKLENGIIFDEKNRVLSNISLVNFVYDPLMQLIIAILQFAGYTYIIFTLHPIMIIPLLLIVVLNLFIDKKRLKIQYEFQTKISRYQRKFGYLFNILINYNYAKEVRINNAASWIAKKFNLETNNYMKVYIDNQKTNYRIDSIGDLIGGIQTIILYVYSAFRVYKREITIGSFSLYIGAASAFMGNLSAIIKQIMNLKNISQYIESYKRYLELVVPTYERKQTRSIDCSQSKYEIEFCNVSFKYPNSSAYVLKNVSLKIKKGERLSVVGRNGSGKSTLIKLLCRLYEPTEGVILYNGIDISTLKHDQYIQLLSIVFQDFNIYSMSLRENICLNNVENDEKIIETIKYSGLKEKLESLPRGLETQIGKEFDANGVEFSGGEQQKIACARAYIKNSQIVILDEPTASLDPVSENQLYQRFNNIIGKKTAIYISHRLASVKFCDNIIVLDNGEIVEFGTHEELMKQKNMYYEMFKKQADYYIEAVNGRNHEK